MKLFTIGHSTRPIDDFLLILKSFNVDAVADVRSYPFSKYTPQFNRAEIERSLKRQSMRYVFLGDELGARRAERSCYVNGIADYTLIRELPLFKKGLSRVVDGLERMSIALMCAERDPLTCHRAVLVARALREQVQDITHISDSTSFETHQDLENRLLQQYRTDGNDLFMSRDQLVENAYLKRGREIAFSEEQPQ